MPRSFHLGGSSARRFVAACMLVLAVAGLARAQDVRSVEVELGFGGEIVAEAWNPLRIRTRDVPDASFELRIDQGSLRDGEILLTYETHVGGRGGLSVYDDDVWIPAWRSLTWSVRSGERVWASGTLGARVRDARPLDLLLTRNPGGYREAFGEGARVVEVTAADLPARGAAYDGVRSLLVDGSASAPRVDAVAAAAATGATVLLVDPLPSSYADLDLLAPAPRQGLGAGTILRTRRDAAAVAFASATRYDRSAALERLGEGVSARAPERPGSTWTLLAVLGYGTVVLLLLRFGRLPGVVAAVGLSGLLSFAAWHGLRPSQTSFDARAALEVSRGGLGVRDVVAEFLTLPAGTLDVPSPVRVGPLARATTTPDGTRLPVQRWSRDRVVFRPSLVAPRVTVDDGRATAVREALSDVWAVGYGGLGDLAPGATVALAAADAAATPASAFAPVLGGLAAGSVLALAPDGTRLLALPSDDVPEAPTPNGATGRARGATAAPASSEAPSGETGASTPGINPFAAPDGAGDASRDDAEGSP